MWSRATLRCVTYFSRFLPRRKSWNTLRLPVVPKPQTSIEKNRIATTSCRGERSATPDCFCSASGCDMKTRTRKKRMKGRRTAKGHVDLKGNISDWSGSPKQPLSPIASDNRRHGHTKDQEMVGGLATCCWSWVTRQWFDICWSYLNGSDLGESTCFWLTPVLFCLVLDIFKFRKPTFINLKSSLTILGAWDWTWAYIDAFFSEYTYLFFKHPTWLVDYPDSDPLQPWAAFRVSPASPESNARTSLFTTSLLLLTIARQWLRRIHP